MRPVYSNVNEYEIEDALEKAFPETQIWVEDLEFASMRFYRAGVTYESGADLGSWNYKYGEYQAGKDCDILMGMGYIADPVKIYI